MISAVLNVRPKKFDPVAFTEEFDIDPAAVFKDGFSVCIVDSLRRDLFVQEFTEALDVWRDIFDELKARGIETELDICVTVESGEQYTCSVALPVDVMKTLTDRGVRVVFSTYPAYDERNRLPVAPERELAPLLNIKRCRRATVRVFSLLATYTEI